MIKHQNFVPFFVDTKCDGYDEYDICRESLLDRMFPEYDEGLYIETDGELSIIGSDPSVTYRTNTWGYKYAVGNRYPVDLHFCTYDDEKDALRSLFECLKNKEPELLNLIRITVGVIIKRLYDINLKVNYSTCYLDGLLPDVRCSIPLAVLQTPVLLHLFVGSVRACCIFYILYKDQAKSFVSDKTVSKILSSKQLATDFYNDYYKIINCILFTPGSIINEKRRISKGTLLRKLMGDPTILNYPSFKKGYYWDDTLRKLMTKRVSK